MKKVLNGSLIVKIFSHNRWIGNLAKNATHAVVAAQLHLDGKNYGLHWFIVQLRNTNNHLPLPGIMIGDNGLKGKFDFC